MIENISQIELNIKDIMKGNLPIKNKKVIKKWVCTLTDKYLVKAIKKNMNLQFKFLDNTSLEGKIKWFNKYNIGIIVFDGQEYIILKHSLKYIIGSV